MNIENILLPSVLRFQYELNNQINNLSCTFLPLRTLKVINLIALLFFGRCVAAVYLQTTKSSSTTYLDYILPREVQQHPSRVSGSILLIQCRAPPSVPTEPNTHHLLSPAHLLLVRFPASLGLPSDGSETVLFVFLRLLFVFYCLQLRLFPLSLLALLQPDGYIHCMI